MECLDQLKINLKRLDNDVEERHISLNDNYFEAIQADEVRRGRVEADITVRKVSETTFELLLHTEGTVIVPCDLCLDDMEQSVCTDDRIMVKYGENNSEEDEVITVDENEGIFDTTWIVYESIALAIPIRHVHAPGKCNASMTEKLNKLSAARSSEENEEQAIDPRWSALSKLKIEN